MLNYMHTDPLIFWLISLSKLYLNQILSVIINNLTTLLGTFYSFKLVGLLAQTWLLGMGRPFQELNVSLLYPVQNQFWCVLGIIVLLEDPTVSNFQPSSYWSEAKLKNSQVVLPLHYSIDFVQYTITTCSRRAPKHDATTSILHSWYGVLRFKSLHTSRTYLLGLWPVTRFNLYLTI